MPIQEQEMINVKCYGKLPVITDGFKYTPKNPKTLLGVIKKHFFFYYNEARLNKGADRDILNMYNKVLERNIILLIKCGTPEDTVYYVNEKLYDYICNNKKIQTALARKPIKERNNSIHINIEFRKNETLWYEDDDLQNEFDNNNIYIKNVLNAAISIPEKYKVLNKQETNKELDNMLF